MEDDMLIPEGTGSWNETEADRKAWRTRQAEQALRNKAKESIDSGSLMVVRKANIAQMNTISHAIKEMIDQLHRVMDENGNIHPYGFEALNEAYNCGRVGMTFVKNWLDSFQPHEMTVVVRPDTDAAIMEFFTKVRGFHDGLRIYLNHENVGQWVADETMGWGQIMGVGNTADGTNLILILWNPENWSWELPEIYPLTYDKPEASE